VTIKRNAEYEIKLDKAAARDLKSISDKIFRRIDTKISNLALNPRPAGVAKLKDNIYRIRVGNFRIIYVIDDKNRKLIISRVRKRAENTYKSIY